MAEVAQRHHDETAEFGDPDYEIEGDMFGDADIYGDEDLGSMEKDKVFDRRNPHEAARIREHVAASGHTDPTNENQDIRRNGGRI